MEKIKTQVLIIGSGGAGLRCAIELFEHGIEDILIIGDREIDDAHTNLAQGGLNAALGTMDPEDNEYIHALDTIHEGVEVSNPILVEKLTHYAPQAINDLIRFGAKFHKEKDGRITQRFFGAHTYRRTCFSGDETGKEIIRVLYNQVERLGIRFMEHVYIFKLLAEDGKVYGAAGFKNGRHILFESNIIVLASGGFSNIYSRSSSRITENYGDGVAMAFDIGAYIGDMEFVQFHPTGLVFPEDKAGMLVTEAVRGEGGILTNNLGERFMSDYDPERMELSTRDIVARAIFQEIKQKRGTQHGGVYLDISKKGLEYIKDRLPLMYETLLKYNEIDISKEKIEVAPTAHYTMGGIYFNHENYKTNIQGLYAIGECSMGLHGANRLGGNSLTETLVFGKLIGQMIHQSSIERPNLPDGLILQAQERYTALTNSKGLVDPIKKLHELRKIMWLKVGIIRSDKELNEALVDVIRLREEVEFDRLKLSGDIESDIKNKSKIINATKLAQMIILAAIERKESRGAHARTDFPAVESNWRKNILFQKDNTEIKSFHKAIPTPSIELQRYLRDHPQTKNYGHLE